MASAAPAAMTLTASASLSRPAISHRQPPNLPARARPGIRRLSVRASSSAIKERAAVGLTAAALAAAMVIPEMAEAAQPGISPSLKNFLLSIVSGGVVLTALVGAVIGVANFDPVKRT